MTRLPLLRLLSVPFAAAILVAGATQASAASSSVNVQSFDREERGASVLVTFSIACAPHGPETNTYFALTLFQGKPDAGNYVEGFGGIVEPPSLIVCDNTTHSYTFNVRPSQFYADRRFRVGPAITEWSVITCTLVAPDTTECTGTELVRENVRISP
jgi:hypothetical protein